MRERSVAQRLLFEPRAIQDADGSLTGSIGPAINAHRVAVLQAATTLLVPKTTHCRTLDDLQSLQKPRLAGKNRLPPPQDPPRLGNDREKRNFGPRANCPRRDPEPPSNKVKTGTPGE